MSTETLTAPTTGRAADAARPARRPRRQPSWRRLQALKGAAFTLPFFAGFALVTIIPLLIALVQSVFQERRTGLGLGKGEIVFAGFDNYLQGLTSEVFWMGMLRVGLFGAVVIPLGLVVSLSMALLLDAVTGKKAKFFRVGFLVPYMVPGIVATLIWIYLYSPKVGPLTPFFEQFGLDLNFFAPGSVWPSMGNIMVWGGIGFNMLLMYGSLRAIPGEIFDAARVDGASEWRIAWAIKVPHLRGIIVLTTMLSIIGSLQIFNEPQLFRSVSPQTVSADWVPVQMIYNQAFVANDPYYAAALSVILAVVVGIASAIFYKFTNRPVS
ncbi:sugar ABC transporter permease [Agromyces atrinae]|uniref:carbohydrate ABC transporter permease n=1 Tax=Agromyces atrinae TaxID=592376 RepID=UPI001F5820ED|nr:sugar ABC transporter permease [Agromyces atrinae]MCI2957211.1 sugar ABC transporter permease [Agromyces atrinae]